MKTKEINDRGGSIAQSGAAISGAGDKERARQAMESVGECLVRRGGRMLLLFTPPFDRTPLGVHRRTVANALPAENR